MTVHNFALEKHFCCNQISLGKKKSGKHHSVFVPHILSLFSMTNSSYYLLVLAYGDRDTKNMTATDNSPVPFLLAACDI